MGALELTPLQDSLKELKNTLFLINGIQKDMNDERNYIGTAISQMTHCVQKLEDQVQKIERQTALLQKTLQDAIAKEINNLSFHFSEEIRQSFDKSFREQGTMALSKLRDAAQGTTDKIRQCRDKISFFSKGFIGLTLIGSMIGGLIGSAVIHYSFPKIDKQTVEQLERGKIFQEIWVKLDQKEQEKLKIVYAQTINPKDKK